MAHDGVGFQATRAEQPTMNFIVHGQVFTTEKQSAKAEVPLDAVPVNPRPTCVDFDRARKGSSGQTGTLGPSTVAPPALVSIYKARMIQDGGAPGCGAPRKTGGSLAWRHRSVYHSVRIVELPRRPSRSIHPQD